jgi:hypothetical protein
VNRHTSSPMRYQNSPDTPVLSGPDPVSGAQKCGGAVTRDRRPSRLRLGAIADASDAATEGAPEPTRATFAFLLILS